MYTYPASIMGFMYRKKSVRRRGVICWPSTPAAPAAPRPLPAEIFRLRGVPSLAVRELSREVDPLEEPLSARKLPGLPSRLAGLRREHRLLEDRARGLRGLVQELRELLVDAGVHDPLHLGAPALP